ncbi:vacuolar-type H+-ATPase subunit I/STV1 [Dysgonomonas sp. PH5-45]|uniref:hypothetical protein n=1 Tax=unclassified Dysgonomonas TaxID=2630389 RepID=UPI0024734CB5|nr:MULTISPECIES: hypothetical protein [unclassified Dysgonomonas]MDH6354687.1 vacuolar-type H+-ATPase subunit I/STV1 [Dysgonomonas sp. PH5-45]MDH6387585.1 vacuolar-type H+-ATPase subunit I/STV1 [Dysgonomonas sp. PH5-37]
MFQTEFKLTIGITPELNSILSGFLGYLSSNKAIPEKQLENTESPEKEKESTGRQTRKSKADKSSVVTESVTSPETEEKDTSTESSGKGSTSEPPADSNSSAITVEMLRAKVKEVITADRSKRDAIEAKFAEFNASNPTTLDVKHYQEYWDFLNNL